MDFSTEAIAIARDFQSEVSFTVWDLESLDAFEFAHDTYDLIVISYVLAFLANQKLFLKTVQKKLSGVCILRVILEHDEKPAVITEKQQLENLLQGLFTVKTMHLLPSRQGVVIAEYHLERK